MLGVHPSRKAVALFAAFLMFVCASVCQAEPRVDSQRHQGCPHHKKPAAKTQVGCAIRGFDVPKQTAFEFELAPIPEHSGIAQEPACSPITTASFPHEDLYLRLRVLRI